MYGKLDLIQLSILSACQVKRCFLDGGSLTGVSMGQP